MVSTYFFGGTVWTGDEREESALLVRDGIVVAIGSEATELADADASTDTIERVDLAGGFLMPAFADGHAHPIFGGLEGEGPQIRGLTSVEQIVAAVRAFAEENPQLEAILGGSYDSSLASEGLFDARWLDDAVADRPVILHASDYHTVWCNTRALELAGIDASTFDPVLGEITRRADGTPLGTLREWGASELVTLTVADHPLETRLRAIERAGEYFLSRGVTWVQDAWAEPANIDAFVVAVQTERLPLRVNLAQYADPRHFADQLTSFIDTRARVEELNSPLLTAHTIKFFADGVIENETGALLEPYCSNVHNHGMSVWGSEALTLAVTAADAAGFQVHIHAIGDSAVRQTLDAIEHAMHTNGPRDRRPVIAHAQLVAPDDLARFAQLGVIPSMQPLWAQLDGLMTVLTLPRLGPARSQQQYRIRTLADSGAPLAFGSDWPVSSGDPRKGIAVAASRQTAHGVPENGWTPDEILPVERALHAYTSGVAYQAFADQHQLSWGRIRPGATADLVWLARDPREVEPLDLPTLMIRETYLAGDPRVNLRRNGASLS
jgi:predicted amidohydrolase YtcJ